jgi:hypothetical protein
MPDAHSRNHLDNRFFSSFATGIADGLIVPFALLAGGTSIINASGNIVPFVLMFIILASLLMAGGSYFTTKKEWYEKKTSPEQKRRDTKRFFANLDLPEEIQEQSADDLLKENEVWDRMAQGESGQHINPTLSGFTTGIGYFAGGFFSLIPFLFIDSSITALKISSLLTLPALFIIGYLKMNGGKAARWLNGLRILVTGAIAAGAAFGIARLL